MIRGCFFSALNRKTKGIEKQKIFSMFSVVSHGFLIEICVVLFTAATEGDQNGLDHPSVEVSLDENSGMLVDGFERTFDGKLKCRYCNYASKGTARLIEHIRIHTGMKYSAVLSFTLNTVV